MPVEIPSVRQLAKELGRSNPTVLSYVKRQDWPFARKGPWKRSDLPKMRRWMAQTLAPDLANPDNVLEPDPVADLRLSPERLAKVRLLITRQAKLELERAILAGDFLDKAEERRRDLEKIQVVKSALQGLSRRLPPLLVGRSVDEISEIIREEATWIMQAFAGEAAGADGPDREAAGIGADGRSAELPAAR